MEKNKRFTKELNNQIAGIITYYYTIQRKKTTKRQKKNKNNSKTTYNQPAHASNYFQLIRAESDQSINI